MGYGNLDDNALQLLIDLLLLVGDSREHLRVCYVPHVRSKPVDILLDGGMKCGEIPSSPFDNVCLPCPSSRQQSFNGFRGLYILLSLKLIPRLPHKFAKVQPERQESRHGLVDIFRAKRCSTKIALANKPSIFTRRAIPVSPSHLKHRREYSQSLRPPIQRQRLLHMIKLIIMPPQIIMPLFPSQVALTRPLIPLHNHR